MRFCRIKITNTVPFASVAANLTHRLAGGLPGYSMLTYFDQDGTGSFPVTTSTTNCYSNTADPVLNSQATVTTDAVGSTTNVASGTLSDLGSPYATDYGFVYSSTNTTPTISDSKVSKGVPSATGSYTAELTSLTPGTTYYVRAYATNSVGTYYGSVVSFVAANLAPTGLSYTTPNVYTKSTAITSLTPTVTGSGISYTISPALPNGLAISATTGVISGTPTVVSATADYTVTATNTHGNTTATVRITVNDIAPSGLSYTTPNVYTKNTAITPLNPTVSGGAVTSYTISPTLPAGLSISSTTGAISGTPTAIASTANYTVTAANSGGSTTKVIAITVNDVAPSGLNYTTPNVFTKGTSITPLNPTVSGGAVVSYTISPALPAGLSISSTTGAISGIPTAITSVANYTVTAANSGGSATKVITITVNDVAPSGLNYTTPNVFTKGTTIATLTPTLSGGGAVIGFSVNPALPAGLSFNSTTGAISGTPTAIASAANYTVTASNSGGSATKVIAITVNDVAPSGLSYTTPNVFTKGTAIASLSPTVSGGAITSCTIAPALPAGLSINATTGVISGTPTVVSAANTYTVTATNTGGSTTATLNITVHDMAPTGLSYTTPNVFTKGTTITSLSPTVGGGTVVNYSVSPALPAGLSINATTGVISGTPTVVSAANTYTVTATNTGGSTTATFDIAINDLAPSGLNYTTPNVYTMETPIPALSPTVSGGAVANYSVSPALPAGLSINATTGVISGTPTVISSATIYTVTATNSGGSTAASLSITVNDVAPGSLSYTTPNVFMKGMTISPLSPTVSGGTVINYSVTPALPAGLSIDASTGVISGTPTEITAAANYTVTATNTGGTASATLSIAVNDVAPTGLSYITPNVFTRGTGITNLVPAVSGGAVTNYSVSPALPAGLSINTSTGVISGTPTVVSAINSYTVTASNVSGSTSFVLSITVNEAAPGGLSYTTPNVFTKGMAISPLAPIVSGIVTSYSVSPALPAGLSINASTGVISGTPTAVSGPGNYTVIASNAGGNISFTISIAVNDIAPSGLSYQTPNVYTKGAAITSLSPTISGGTVTRYSIVPALPSGLSFNSSTGVISGTPTAVVSATNYTVTATNSGGSVSFALSITVNDIPPTGLSYSTPNMLNKGTAITALSPSVSGGTVTTYSVSPVLPVGLSIDPTTGIISGTPSAISTAADYTVTASNTGGSTYFTINITVFDAAPSGLKYTTPNVFTKGRAITALVPTVNGGTVTGYSVSPALPTGLSINTTTGVISGTPTVVTPAGNYTVTASNTGGSCTFTVSITVNDDITINPLVSPSAGCEASDFALTYTVLSGVPTQYQIKFSNQAILAGLSDIAYTTLSSSTGGVITFSVPKGMKAGTFTGYLQLKDNAGAESLAYPFEFTVNLSSDYIITKFDDVIACDNSSYRFVSYQWYKNGAKIEGATKQFYNDPSGLTGTYVLQVTTTDGNTFFSCPKTISNAKKSVKMFPNPVKANRTFSVQVIGFEAKELSTATLAVYDMQGVCVYKSATVSDMNTLQLPSSQVYVGHVTTSNGEDYSFKVVIQK